MLQYGLIYSAVDTHTHTRIYLYNLSILHLKWCVSSSSVTGSHPVTCAPPSSPTVRWLGPASRNNAPSKLTEAQILLKLSQSPLSSNHTFHLRRPPIPGITSSASTATRTRWIYKGSRDQEGKPGLTKAATVQLQLSGYPEISVRHKMSQFFKSIQTK